MPRIAPETEEKDMNSSSIDALEEHCLDEMWEAIEKKNIKAFRSAFEALFLNCFEDGE